LETIYLHHIPGRGVNLIVQGNRFRFRPGEDMRSHYPKKKDYLYQYKPKRKNKNPSLCCSPDRRTAKDRRKSQNPNYFLKGGIERRSWKERRYLWYMTM
jgi:hypothetical protein